MSKAALIALVATAVIVDGQRVVIQPGQPLPDLNDHDASELVASGAAEDPKVSAALEQQAKEGEAAARKEFEDARAKVQAKQASVAADETGEGEKSDPANPAKAKAAGTK